MRACVLRLRRRGGEGFLCAAKAGQQQVVQDYARKLTEQETQIAKLRDRQGALETQRSVLQERVNGLIEKLEF